MSILIKDMEMPERCLECPFYDNYNYYCTLYSFGIPARYNRDGSTRPEWCEIKELPECEDVVSRQEAIGLVNDHTFYDDYDDTDKNCLIDGLLSLPSAQPEPTRIISETRAIPSDDDSVSLSETVTATYYDEEKEEWSRRIVTVRDVLDSVCDEYTVLPTAHTERKKGKWIPHHEENPLDGSRGGVICSNCGWKTHNKMHLLMGCSYRFCPNCGYRMEGDDSEID